MLLQSLLRPVLTPIMRGVFDAFGSSAPAWSPLSLWPDGIDSPGMWISPRTLTSEWQDYTGTTPVSVPGTVADASNPVGLALDIRAGATVLTDPGNHMLQSTSSARPLMSARVNLLTYTEDFANGYWLNATATVTPNYGTAPDGTQTSTRLVFPGANNAILKVNILAANVPSTASCWVKGPVGETLQFDASLGAGNLVTLTGAWQRATCPHAAGQSFVIGTYAGATARDVEVWHPQFELGLDATTYQRVTTDSDYDGDPAKFPYKEQFDGVDDFQVTASGGGASTAAMVCLGFTSTLAGTAQTLWTDRTGNTGLSLGISAGNAIVLSGGNGSSIVTVTGDAVTLGTPYVVTALYDGTDLSVQLNDATPATGACALSAGQAAITLGAATGGASGFFKGSIFDVLYVKDATTSPADVAEAKAWVAAKSGVTL